MSLIRRKFIFFLSVLNQTFYALQHDQFFQEKAE